MLRHGILVYGSSRAELSLLSNALTPATKQIWDIALPNLWLTQDSAVPAKLDTFATIPALRSALAGKCDIILASEPLLQMYGLHELAASVYDCEAKFEIVRFDSCSDSFTVRELEQLATSPLRAGNLRVNYYASRFATLVANARTFGICDRFGALRFSRYLMKPRLKSPDEGSGLGWLLDEINQTAPQGARVQVFARDTEAREVVASLDWLTNGWASRRMGPLELILTPDADFQKHAHGRHFRFGNISVFVDRGVEIFDSTKLANYSTFKIMESGEAEAIELELRRFASDVVIF